MAKNALSVESVPRERLFCSPANPRHNDAAVPHVAASIRRFGFQQPIVAKRTGEVIAGNTRLKAAMELGITEIPTVWFDGTDIDAVAFAIADNRTAEFATWNHAALGKLLAELQAEDALEGVGYSTEEIDALLLQLEADASQGTVDDPGPGEVPERPVSRPGDLWLLGNHRLLCGDSTNESDMARLMAGDTASLLSCDPPYLVSYQGGNHPQSWSNKPDVKDKHWDDYVDPTTGLSFFTNWLRVALAHCSERVPVYQWHATRRQSLVEQAWQANGLLVHQTLIWAKARPVLTRCHFMWSHEPCFYGWREGFMPENDRRPPPNERTIWDIDQVGQQDGIHPTQKPTLLFEKPIEFHTRLGEIVLEPFSGSGSQLIAAEKLHRRCRAMEVAPGYVDVAVRRWEAATGKLATLAESDKTFAVLAREREIG